MVVLKLALKVGSDFNLWGCKGSRFQVTGKQWCISQAWLLLGLNENIYMKHFIKVVYFGAVDW